MHVCYHFILRLFYYTFTKIKTDRTSNFWKPRTALSFNALAAVWCAIETLKHRFCFGFDAKSTKKFFNSCNWWLFFFGFENSWNARIHTKTPSLSNISRTMRTGNKHFNSFLFFFFCTIFDLVPLSVGLELVLWIFSIGRRLSQVNPFISFVFIARDWNKESKWNDKTPKPKKKVFFKTFITFAIRTDLCSLLNTDYIEEKNILFFCGLLPFSFIARHYAKYAWSLNLSFLFLFVLSNRHFF